MAPSNTCDVNKTPIKVRGKRRGHQSEKLRKGNQRRPTRWNGHMAQTNLLNQPLDLFVSSKSLKCRHDVISASPFEKLPTEIVQLIFEYSTNVDLPLTSRKTMMALSKSQHLQMQLTTELLSPVLGNSGNTASTSDLARAVRLLNSRFVTWPFFTQWLCDQSVQQTYSTDLPSLCEMWSSLNPSPRLLPPKKLLHFPFTEDKTRFLTVLSHNVHDVSAQNSLYGELAQVGLTQAVREGYHRVASLILDMGVLASTELLRIAVCDRGCDKDMLQILVGGSNTVSSMSTNSGVAEIDLLDPTIWTWADKNVEGQGTWLKTFLQSIIRQREGLTIDFVARSTDVA